jgi:hypothetical protein
LTVVATPAAAGVTAGAEKEEPMDYLESSRRFAEFSSGLVLAIGWSPDWWTILVVGGFLTAIAVLAVFVYLQVKRPRHGGEPGPFVATFLWALPSLINVALVVTIIVYLTPVDDGPMWQEWGRHVALLAGLLVPAVLGVPFAYFRGRYSTPANLNPRVAGEISTRLKDLNARIAACCPSPGEPALQPDVATDTRQSQASSERVQLSSLPGAWLTRRIAKVVTGRKPDGNAVLTGKVAACSTAQGHLEYLEGQLGMQRADSEKRAGSCGARWVLGTGYIDLWLHLHAAEEALFLVQPEEEVIASAVCDELRLKDSNIEHHTDYLDKLRWAVSHLGGARYLSASPPLPALGRTKRSASVDTQARVILRDVRHAINDFRDSRRDGFVRARNRLVLTGTFTGLTVFAILGLAVIAGVTQTMIISATAFYLVGSVIGLFDQLRRGLEGVPAIEEDYGLAHTRLFFTPMLSGLAAVTGVLVTAMLFGALSGSIATSDVAASEPASRIQEFFNLAESAAATDAQIPQEVPRLQDIYNLRENPFGFVVAAIFGLTPGLLTNRLQAQTARYTADLQSTSSQGQAR